MNAERTLEWAARLLLVALGVWIWKAEARLTKLEIRQLWLHGDVGPEKP